MASEGQAGASYHCAGRAGWSGLMTPVVGQGSGGGELLLRAISREAYAYTHFHGTAHIAAAPLPPAHGARRMPIRRATTGGGVTRERRWVADLTPR